MELSSIMYELFIWRLSSISEAGVLTGILLLLHNGKTDPHPQHMMLWSDDVLPQMCGLWLPLLWLKLTNIRSGYIFASESRIKSNVPLIEGIDEGQQLTQEELDSFF
jgi:hypothetical protein